MASGLHRRQNGCVLADHNELNYHDFAAHGTALLPLAFSRLERTQAGKRTDVTAAGLVGEVHVKNTTHVVR